MVATGLLLCPYMVIHLLILFAVRLVFRSVYTQTILDEDYLYMFATRKPTHY
jgi:hypothetical protein